jgi:peptidyl-prolyl cis-trans isomerase SurA
VTARFRLAAHVAAVAALTLALWPWHSGGGPALAQSPVKRTAKAEPGADLPAKGQGIVVVVNDDAITAYDIDQRARFAALATNIGDQAKEEFQRLIKADSTQAAVEKLKDEVVRDNPGKGQEELIAIFKERQGQLGMALQKQAVENARASVMPKLRRDAKEELIEERLKLQEAKKLGVEVTDAEVKALIKDIADRNKMTYDEFAAHLKQQGVDVATMGEKFRATKAWRDTIGRRYGAQATVSQRDVDQFLATAAAETGADALELQLHRISLGLAGRADQGAWTRRYAEAEGLRRRFAGCKTMGDLAKSVPDSRFEDMKFVKPVSLGEPMRTLLLSAKDDEALPPVATDAGVDLYAVCARRIVGGDAERAKAMLQGKELAILAERHLRNLRQEANIEYK